jgi:transposase
MTARPNATGNATDLVALAIEGLSSTEIAKRVGLHRSSVWRALNAPENAARLAEARASLREGARVRIDGMTENALDAIASVLSDVGAPHAARLRAAEMVLDRAGIVPLKTEPTNEQDDAPADPAEVLELARRIVAAEEKR